MLFLMLDGSALQQVSLLLHSYLNIWNTYKRYDMQISVFFHAYNSSFVNDVYLLDIQETKQYVSEF